MSENEARVVDKLVQLDGRIFRIKSKLYDRNAFQHIIKKLRLKELLVTLV